MGLLVLLLGAAVGLVTLVLLVIKAFQTDVLWGIACLVCWPVTLLFVILHWPETKNVFLVQLIGAALIVCGFLMTASARGGA
jgi:hypothetical protein